MVDMRSNSRRFFTKLANDAGMSEPESWANSLEIEIHKNFPTMTPYIQRCLLLGTYLPRIGQSLFSIPIERLAIINKNDIINMMP